MFIRRFLHIQAARSAYSYHPSKALSEIDCGNSRDLFINFATIDLWCVLFKSDVDRVWDTHAVEFPVYAVMLQ